MRKKHKIKYNKCFGRAFAMNKDRSFSKNVPFGCRESSKVKSNWLEFLAFSILLALIVGGLGYIGYHICREDSIKAQADINAAPAVVIDAGHGGMDGGATGVNGVPEKKLNLELAEKTAALCRLNGMNVIMTRDSDRSLGEDAPKGKRKMTDLVKRLEIANANPDAVFFSIHMNKYPMSVCRGLQVWYSPNNSGSKRLADIVESGIKSGLQTDNYRESKKAGSAIYLLDRMKNPAILVECGFLSNEEECTLLCSNEYQVKLAVCFCGSISAFISGNET